MKIGLIYPAMELNGSPEALLHVGLAAEKLGYDHLLAGDHVLGANHDSRDPELFGPYDEHTPFHDPFVIFAYLAGITKRLNFVSSVLVLPQRQTALVAKQAADLDLVSGQRLTLGVGTGWSYVEYDALGKEFKNRGKRIDEQITLLRELWTKDLVDFNGEFERVDRAAIIPRPRRRIPIYLGGFADVAFKRAAKIGDGFVFADIGRDVFESLDKLRDYMRDEGRSLDGFGLHLAMGSQSIAETVTLASRWHDAGGTHASVWTMDRGFKTAAEHIDFAAQAAGALVKAGLMAH